MLAIPGSLEKTCVSSGRWPGKVEGLEYPMMENQMEKKMENEMEAGII